ATEGGARIHGAIELPFQEAIDRYIDRTHLKQPIHLTCPTPSEVVENRCKVEDKLVFMEQYVASMQSTVASLFEKVATVIQKLDKSKARTNLDQVDYDELASLMGEIDEIKAKFEEKEFVDIFIDATQALIIHYELEIARIQVRPIQNDDDRRLKMIDWIYAHHPWLFALAGIMEAELIVIRRRGIQSRYVHKAEFSEDGILINGHFYDYKNEIQDFEIELVIDGEAIFATTLIGKDSKVPFSFTIPSRFFNDQVHRISVREKSTGIILTGMPENRLLLSADKNKAQFMESLDVHYEQKNPSLNHDKSISFLATEDNLNDGKLIEPSV
ncbi:MAG: motility associated factor glycosyltransferase family protein, partial [Sulfuricurvum sp.]|nr:motility associated factor glycosyltransferase family protein [Sulfuricurvum sp.]